MWSNIKYCNSNKKNEQNGWKQAWNWRAHTTRNKREAEWESDNWLCLACRVCFSSDSGFAVGIYTTNSPEACQYVADNCKANIIVVENHKQLQKILQVSPGMNDKDKALEWEHQLAQMYDDEALFVGEGLSSFSLFSVTKGLTN